MLFCDRYYVNFNIFWAFGMMPNRHISKDPGPKGPALENFILGDHGREAL